ncbi:PHP domain-containing protein [Halobaculum sp. MBLA0147]|uniref:PHP domain-containing protein n=1 Tax=Halobaculum sp. MBLA0147 TaxID=3079934 RepID=UPI0035256F1E
MVVADLHVHTTVSDGTLTLDAVPSAARAADVSVVAITDHDRYHPGLDAPVQTLDGITVVRGIELRVETDTERVDLLGYGLHETAALAAECDRIQRDRQRRGREIVTRVEAETGVDLDVTVEPGFGRPDVARAVAASDAPYDYGETFDDLIGAGRPCYVPRDVTPVDEAVPLLREACDVVGLAHPFRYDDPAAALDLISTYDLDAVERFYDYAGTDQPDPTPVDELVDAEGLLRTGGSDAHDETLGVAGLDAADWERLRARLDTSALGGA